MLCFALACYDELNGAKCWEEFGWITAFLKEELRVKRGPRSTNVKRVYKNVWRKIKELNGDQEELM